MHTLFRDAAGPSLAPRGSVVCIGAFDGVHRGHRFVLDHVRRRADDLGLTPIAISFEPIPREFFARGEPLPRLASAREKIARLRDSGMQRLLLLRFNAALAAMSAEDFIADVLVARVGAREIVVGRDFRFGHARRGDMALLKAHGLRHGFRATELDSFLWQGERVSSSAIRRLLAAGEFNAAANQLGRRFSIGGHVVRGQQLGRKLGYPTANLRLGRRVAPVQGIFAVWVHGVGNAPHPAVASLGVRPTVAGTEPLLESHLFDFDGDLYGRRIEVEFVQKLRDEEKFPDLPSLVRQMDDDAAAARRILGAPRLVAAGA
ncbi:bifunctional riboflavin kinase/FAD synthetase [Tahibacter amnicola]|uniref:Riboflavin biosynthesis protein n=1 Tax=Tahibacter amnicola TaxID=2976241 RepID=A0ABY6BBK0_9GAMM|nr:bifunctional riboflavin kinase/FAD synthetase [Tahibacter amnicola]UXI67187.1 bifunctional riboflavin kinase/FAD synthetase [Tahibacter amnicola]